MKTAYEYGKEAYANEINVLADDKAFLKDFCARKRHH